ncbi:membrane protein [Flavobacterium suaedae]|uniref:Membrane protein n=1 Tax=Flavobacterium suaedae TaxID=1767027 RepID=A0ABQ1JSR7_9FLAO|nr:DUF5686 and carboxypeptidase regulatory-like domain-containing protein [Flavobacterium suaedae]GGB74697.1 membrane protein [Flavobacterium suaedae]
MLRIFTALFFLYCISAFSQIKGKITSTDGEPIPFVSITVENTYQGTTANENGEYQLDVKSENNYALLFQSIGFKTKRVPVSLTNTEKTINITLEEEHYQLNEVVISSDENPANAIMRSAIANKKKNSAKTGRFEADFYSKGLFRVADMPDKILGISLEEEKKALDSTGSGIIYLSETVSKIKFEQPDNLKEHIIASKISGDDNGFSYNTAMGTFYNFYDNYIEFGINMVSPLADNAFNYYRFSFEGSFFDENETMINKIKVIPRRDKEPVFEGYIYIVEKSWAISAVDLDIKGYRMQQPIIETMNLKQNFSFNEHNRVWAKNSQFFDFKAGAFGIKFNGKFSHIYTNYVFKDQFEKDTFGKEIVYFERDSNKKDSLYWKEVRPIPLTEEEVTDYIEKDSIQTLHSSKAYLDSIDKKNNKFRVFDVLKGYTYRNSYKNTRYTYDGLISLSGISFNTVQGWNFKTGLSFNKYNEETGKYTSIRTDFNYGIAEDRLRVTGSFIHRFNRENNALLYLTGGSKAEQYNEAEPITRWLNMFRSLVYENNYMKLYGNTFAKAQYQQNIFTGLFMAGNIEYTRRKALTNNTDYVLFKGKDDYTSNNPLDPESDAPAFETHNLMKARAYATIRFGEKYINRPDGKIPIRSEDYPSFKFMYEKGFAGSEHRYNYDFLAGSMTYKTDLGNKGNFGFKLSGGKFFNAEDISFVDYKHFNGNQTNIIAGQNRLNSFNILPYYTHSTNDKYMEIHADHDFKGYIMNKIPLLNLLQFNLTLGYHQAATPQFKPYQEFSVGFSNVGIGKFRLLRIDYVRSYQGSAFAGDGIMVGLEFLNLID